MSNELPMELPHEPNTPRGKLTVLEPIECVTLISDDSDAEPSPKRKANTNNAQQSANPIGASGGPIAAIKKYADDDSNDGPTGADERRTSRRNKPRVDYTNKANSSNAEDKLNTPSSSLANAGGYLNSDKKSDSKAKKSETSRSPFPKDAADPREAAAVAAEAYKEILTGLEGAAFQRYLILYRFASIYV